MKKCYREKCLRPFFVVLPPCIVWCASLRSEEVVIGKCSQGHFLLMVVMETLKYTCTPSFTFVHCMKLSCIAHQPIRLSKKERKKERHRLYPKDIQSYTTTNKDRHTIKQHKIGHWMPSLESWGGGLKSLLWLANSPHTPSVLT